ncbi:MAG: hypothetical protein EBX37_16595 [Alphaproteobacteria bacterium]|jgi:hypothetical protein|nr:hypothetical protein [Alphaproteobacteria bacterium]
MGAWIPSASSLAYQRMLDEGRYASVTEMAAAEKIDRGYLGRLLQLTLLAPELIELALNGGQDPINPSMIGAKIPLDWDSQRAGQKAPRAK